MEEEPKMNLPIHIVQIVSEDKIINEMKKRIEKLCHFEAWVDRALYNLEKSYQSYNDIFLEKNMKKRKELILDLESYFMSSILLYLRCFQDSQKQFHLKIHSITNEPTLIKCHNGIYQLRNDEFTHWKGLRSKANVYYKFHIDKAKLKSNYNEAFEISIEENFGPCPDENMPYEKIKELFTVTLEKIDSYRSTTYDKLIKRLFTKNVFKDSDLLNKNGESILKGLSK